MGKYGVANPYSLSNRCSSFFPLCHASRVDGVRDLDVINKVIRQPFKRFASLGDENFVLLSKNIPRIKIMLDEIVDVVCKLKINLLKLHLALTTFDLTTLISIFFIEALKRASMFSKVQWNRISAATRRA